MITATYNLGDFTKIHTGKLDANASSVDGEYPFFTCAKDPLRISSHSYDCECVLVAGNGDLNVKYYRGKFDAYQRTYIVEIRPEFQNQICLRYAYHFLEDYLEILREQSIGGIIKYIKLGNLTDAKIPLPPLAEQKRIVAILDAADALRVKRRESLAQLDTLLQSTFLDMFGDPVTNPMGWEVEPLGKICDVRDGTHDSPMYMQEGHPLLTSKNFKDGAINYDGANLITDEDYQKINKRSKVDIGDLVMPMIGTIGNPVLVEQEPNFSIKNVALIKFASNSPDNRFVRSLLCSHYFDQITSKASRGGTQKFVALKDLRGMPIPTPPLDLQNRFASIVESVERQKTTQRAHLKELDTLFAALQQRAFNGELTA